MTDSKHTPGPWEYVSEDDGHSIYDCDCGFHIARVTDGLPPGVTEANARLIAAAPEMYEALECIAQIHDGNPSDAMADMPPLDYARHMLGVARREARAALAKAEGTS
jgi:hypothetical protein